MGKRKHGARKPNKRSRIAHHREHMSAGQVARSAAASAGCVKLAYASKRRAMAALVQVRGVRRRERTQGVGVPGKGERSTYRCPRCQQWHLTSLARGARR